MAIETVNTRSILVSDLATTLHLHTIEIPFVLRENLERRDVEGVEVQLTSVCQELFGLNAADVITSTKWANTTAAISRISSRLPYSEKSQHPSEYFSSEARSSSPDRFFLNCLFRAVMRPVTVGSASPATWLFNELEHLPPGETYDSLSRAQIAEAEFQTWYWLTNLLARYPSPDVAAKVPDLLGMDVPFSGSPSIKPITLAQLSKWCYGSAALMVGSTALRAAGQITLGQVPSLVAVVSGGASGLVFASLGVLLEQLEAYLRHKPQPEPATGKKSIAQRSSSAKA